MTKYLLKFFFLLFTLYFLPCTPCFSFFWEFGQNKVQYKNFDWKVIDTEHFSIVYYDGGEQLAKFANSVLQDSYNRLSNVFNYNLLAPAPVIIYNSHNDFEQTNITLSLIDENTGGFTEIFKNRVVVPFDGSYEDFRHVLSHEYTHAFQFAISRGQSPTAIISFQLQQVPLWFIEGMAEYFSLGWDANSDMTLRDALYWDKIRSIQDLYQIEGSYLMYKEGHSVVRFVAQRYGEDKIGKLFRRTGTLSGFNGALENVLGIDTEELNRLWMQELKSTYWNSCAGKKPAPENARQLTDRKGYVFNTAPAISPDGSEIAFFSDRDGYESIYLMSSVDGRIKKKITAGGRTKEFESMHILQTSIAWSPDGKNLVFCSKTEGKDVLYILNVNSGKRVAKFLFEEIDRLFSPAFSPDGKKIAMRVVKNGQADISILDIASGETEQITDDQYDDVSPSWSPDGKYLLFSSDRPSLNQKWKYGYYSLFKIYVDNRAIQELSLPCPRASYLSSPTLVIDDSIPKILFVSNHTGANNIFIYNLRDSSLVQLTDVIGGVYMPSISHDNKHLVFSLYSNMGWDIYIMKNPTVGASLLGVTAQSVQEFNRNYTEVSKEDSSLKSKNLGFRLSPDWGGGGLSYETGGRMVGYFKLALSDWLGNHQIYLETSAPENLTASYFIQYLYLPKKLDFGGAFYNQEYYYYIMDNIWEIDKSTGAQIILEYPLDKFRRFDLCLNANLQKAEIFDYASNTSLDEIGWYIVGPELSFVLDNSLWGPMGPEDGSRRKFSILTTQNWKQILPEGIGKYVDRPFIRYNFYKIDLRKYIRFARNYSFATRLINAGIWGEDKNMTALYIGGPEDLRGYETGEFRGDNIGLLNLEFRYPFIDQIKLAFPIPISIGGIKGVMFADFAYASDNPQKLKVFRDGRLSDLKLGFGTGIRISFQPYFVIKTDIAWHSDLSNTSKQIIHFSLAPDF